MPKILIAQSKKHAVLASLFTVSLLHAGLADAKKPAVDCEALGRFAKLSLTNRLIGVPYQPTASNIFTDSPYSAERTTQSSKGAVFSEAYEESSLHKTPEAFGAEVIQHCLRGEFLK